MRQYLKKNIEHVIIAIALICAVFFQYLRISSLDIAFLYETQIASNIIYLLVILLVPLVVFVFVFIPLLFVFEVTIFIQIQGSLHLNISKVIYRIKPVVNQYITKSNHITILRC